MRTPLTNSKIYSKVFLCARPKQFHVGVTNRVVHELEDLVEQRVVGVKIWDLNYDDKTFG